MLSSALGRYVCLVIGGGAAALLVTVVHASLPPWGAEAVAVAALLVVGVVVGECLPARIWRGEAYSEYTFSGPFTVALLVVGPFWLALLAQSVALLVDDLRAGKQRVKVLFNLSQYAISITCASAVFASLTDQDFGAASGGGFTSGQLLPALLAAGVYFLVNVVLLAVVIALSTGERLLPSVVSHTRNELTMTTLLLCIAPVVVVSLQFSLLTAPLCLLSIVAVRESARTAAAAHVQALHDTLTGLPNRGLLVQRAERAAEVGHGGDQVALLMIDLDHFKEINDTLGHPVGDQLLRLVADRLRSAQRPEDTVARFGGDEFAVLCPGVADVEVAEQIAQRWVDVLAEPFALEQITLHVGASVGIALYPQHADGLDQLVQRADIALYQAKAERGSIATYDESHDSSSVERLTLMEQLRAGMEAELVVHYQPKCRATDGALVGVEALVRWVHPQHGLLQPGQFLPAAENAGLVVPMTMHILRKALEQVGLWRRSGLAVNVAVNVSPRHLSDLRLPDQVAELLAEAALPASVLTLEVTENSIMSDPERAAAVLRRMRAQGIAVSIDDFGTGYSSLGYLRDLSATEVKIDRTFVASASTSDRDLAIVRAAVDLGHSLGLTVVAEGVEDTTTAGLMAATGCDLLQGYLLLPPVPAEQLLAWSTQPHAWSSGPTAGSGSRALRDVGVPVVTA